MSHPTYHNKRYINRTIQTDAREVDPDHEFASPSATELVTADALDVEKIDDSIDTANIHSNTKAVAGVATGLTLAEEASRRFAGLVPNGGASLKPAPLARHLGNTLSKANLIRGGATLAAGFPAATLGMALAPAAYNFMEDPKGNAARLGDDLGVNQSTNIRENIKARQTAPSKMESIVAPGPQHERGIADWISPQSWDNAHQTDPSLTGQAKNFWHDLTRDWSDY